MCSPRPSKPVVNSFVQENLYEQLHLAAAKPEAPKKMSGKDFSEAIFPFLTLLLLLIGIFGAAYVLVAG